MRKLISFDWAVKKILRSKANFGILEGFLSELLKEDIKIKQLLESESNKDIAISKQNRVDLLVENTKGELFVILLYSIYHFNYMQLLDDNSSIRNIYNYYKTNNLFIKIISIYIPFLKIGDGSDYIYKFNQQYLSVHSNDVLKLDNSQKHVFEPVLNKQNNDEYYLILIEGFNNSINNKLDEWIYYIKNAEIKENFSAKNIQDAKQILFLSNLNDSEIQDYDSYQFELHYQASMYLSNYTLGNLEGSLRGREEGIEIGKEEKAKEIAIKAKQSNIPIETIIALTGLNKEQIDNL